MTRFLVLATLLAACSDSGGGSNGPVRLEELAAKTGAVSCQHELRCCDDAEIMADFGSVTVGGQNTRATTSTASRPRPR